MEEMPSLSPLSLLPQWLSSVRPLKTDLPRPPARQRERGRFPMTHSALARQEEEHDHEAGERRPRPHPQTRTISSSFLPSFGRPTRPGVIFLHRGFLPKRNDVPMHGHSPAAMRRRLHCPSKVSSDAAPHSDENNEMRPNQQQAHGSTRGLVMMLPSGKTEERL